MYRLLLHPSIEKQLSKIPAAQARRLADTMRALRDDPRPQQCKHLTENLYRVREGEYRIIYAVFDKELVVFACKVGRRSEKIYRDLAALLAAARERLENE